MNVVLTIVLAVQMLSALGMIGLILVQHGKGADMGAAFGSGGSGSLFGASGSANFLSRTTGVLAALFFACTLLLAYFGGSIAAAQQLQRAGRRCGDGSCACCCGFRRGQIPGTTAPASTSAAVPAPPAPAASGAAQIPTK
jgi:preprotein translocase subunit SecG